MGDEEGVIKGKEEDGGDEAEDEACREGDVIENFVEEFWREAEEGGVWLGFWLRFYWEGEFSVGGQSGRRLSAEYVCNVYKGIRYIWNIHWIGIRPRPL
jgi:hypothetical protein